MKWLFNEVLNDCHNYFLLGDPLALAEYCEACEVDDAAAAFVSTELGLEAAALGKVIPVVGVENYPYHVEIIVDEDAAPLDNIAHQQRDYCLEIISRQVYVYTWPYLVSVAELPHRLEHSVRPKVALENGYYSVAITCGETRQTTGLEPTFRFELRTARQKPHSTADLHHSFSFLASEY